MNLNVGDFIKTKLSKFPSLIVQKGTNTNKDLLLVTIHEYNGDYAWINKEDLTPISLKAEEELCIVVNYGSWFREHHEKFISRNIIKKYKKLNPVSLKIFKIKIKTK